VADHGAVAPGESSVADGHYGGARPKPRRAIRPRTPAEKAFCGLGASAEAFLAGAAAAGHTRLGPELVELNTLATAHGHDTFLPSSLVRPGCGSSEPTRHTQPCVQPAATA